VRYLASIVLCQTGTQVVGDPDIEAEGIETLKNVDILHGALPSYRGRAYTRF
jgi:hypothetical protein